MIQSIKCNSVLHSEHSINITWAVTRKCTMSCSYCSVCKPFIGNRDLDYYKNSLDYILATVDKYQSGDLLFFGGEPTCFPYIDDAILTVWDCAPHIKLSIFTNLTAPLHFYKKFQRYCGYIETSYHYGFPAKEYFDKVSKLDKSLTRIYIMLDPRCRDECFWLYARLKELDFQVQLDLIRDDTLPLTKEDACFAFKESILNCTYADEYEVTFDNGKVELMTQPILEKLDLCNFEGYQCKAGSNSLFIECNGDIYPCQVYSNKGLPKLGNTAVTKPTIFPHVFYCQSNDCSCELYLPKWK